MLRVFLGICAWALCSCVFTGGKGGRLPDSPPLRVDFDSAAASAHLHWEPASSRGFLYYEVQRALGPSGEFVRLTQRRAIEDTAWVDAGLQANLTYRYRLVTHWGRKGETRESLPGATVEGGIHRFMTAWSLPPGFLPTRLVIDDQGIVSVTGAGAGRVERFDRAGHSSQSWSFTPGQLACLETGTLDAAAAALDRGGNLYVIYNLLEKDQQPSARWTKFDAQGKQVWARPLAGVFARHIAIDPENRIFIESIDQLHQFDVEGEEVAQYRVPPLLVSSLRFWKNHFALLVEPVNFTEVGWQAPRLVVYSSPERTDAELVIGRDPLSPEDRGNGVLQRPSDFAVDEAQSRAFVVNAGQSRIEVFSHGQFLTYWGREGEGEGEFRFSGVAPVIEDLAAGKLAQRRVVAGGIARDQEGCIYVADTFNNRIQKFQP